MRSYITREGQDKKNPFTHNCRSEQNSTVSPINFQNQQRIATPNSFEEANGFTAFEKETKQHYSPSFILQQRYLSPHKNHSKKAMLLTFALLFALCTAIVWVTKKRHSSASFTGQQLQTAGAVIIPNPGKSQAVNSTSEEEKEKELRKNWREYIRAHNSNYGYGLLGGINNLSVLFVNKTDYPLEQITAKLTYIKANGKPWKSKYISVFNMLPHSERKQTLPKVGRGKSVEVSITKAVSKGMHFTYEAGKKPVNANDPYFSN